MIDVLGSVVTGNDKSGNSTNFIAIQEEQVGFVDDKQRKVFTWRKSDWTPKRGFTITENGNTWFVVDIRDDGTSLYEARCDLNLERT